MNHFRQSPQKWQFRPIVQLGCIIFYIAKFFSKNLDGNMPRTYSIWVQRTAEPVGFRESYGTKKAPCKQGALLEIKIFA